MNAPRVIISEHAFLQLLVASVELYPTGKSTKKSEHDGETYGYLFGSYLNTISSTPVCKVDFIVSCQRVAERTLDSVRPSAIAEERILSVLNPYPGFDLLGTFHSHPYSNKSNFNAKDTVEPSKDDHKSWEDWWGVKQKMPIGLELIVGLQMFQRKGTKSTRIKDRNCIEGRWERFAYAIGAWYTTEELSHKEEALYPVDWLMCPTAFGIENVDLRQ